MISVRVIGMFLLATSATALYAGDRSNVRGMGMGRTFLAGSRGTEALGINPANLAAPSTHWMSFSLFPVGARMSTEMFGNEIYQEYFTGVPGKDPNGKREPRYLTEADKNRILSSLPDGVSRTRFDLEMMEFGATLATDNYGSIGFGMLEHAGALLDMPKDYARFYLRGLDSAGSSYDFNGTSINAWWWREYNISYALRIEFAATGGRELYLGVGLKLLRGYGTFQTDRYSASIANERVGTNQYILNAQFDHLSHRSGADFFNEDKALTISFFPEPAGTGAGFDLGASAQPMSGLFVSASITDIGSITWDRNVFETSARYSLRTDDPFTTSNTDSLDQAMRGENRAGKTFSTPLPTTLRIGVLVETGAFEMLRFLPANMLLAFDYHQGLNASLGNVTTPRVSVGVEYRGISFLPLRTGLSMGGGEGVRWSAGFGLDFKDVRLDIATENLGTLLTPNSTQMLSAAAGLSLYF